MTQPPDSDGMFLASDPGRAERPNVRDELVSAVARDAELRLTRVLDRIHERVADIRADDAERDVDPEVVALLEEITGRPDAPLEQKSLRRRVHEQRTTWKAFWLAPRAEAGGMELHQAVNDARVRAAQTAMSDWAARNEQYLAEQPSAEQPRRHPEDPGGTGGIGPTRR